MFSKWLSALAFSGGGFNNVAVAEGLAEALMMFSSLYGSQTQQNADGRRHCILVAASNPRLVPTPVNGPVTQILEQSGIIEAHTSIVLADAATVAKAFPQCSVSLSVICPRKLPELRAIYNAGKRNLQAADPPVDTSKNPNFLVLISKNFSEACAAFSNTEMGSLASNQGQVEMDMSSVPPVSEPTATSNPLVPVLLSVPNTTPVLSRGNDAKPDRHASAQMMHSRRGMHQNVPTEMATGMPLGIDAMMPTPGRIQQGQPRILPLGRNKSAEANMSLSHQQTLATLPSAQSGYVKLWEGNLNVPSLGEPLMRLQGYKRASASELLAANWPPTMQFQHIISKEHMNKQVGQHTERANVLVFLAMKPHALLNKLREMHGCAVISLPSQTLILDVSDETSCLIGYLFPSEDSEVRPTITNLQLRASPLPQSQQQHRAQPLLEQLQQERAQPLLEQFQQQQRKQSLLAQQQQLQQLPQQPPRLL